MRMTSIYIITKVYNSKYCLNKQKIMREGVTLREKRMFGLSPVTPMAHEQWTNSEQLSFQKL